MLIDHAANEVHLRLAYVGPFGYGNDENYDEVVKKQPRDTLRKQGSRRSPVEKLEWRRRESNPRTVVASGGIPTYPEPPSRRTLTEHGSADASRSALDSDVGPT